MDDAHHGIAGEEPSGCTVEDRRTSVNLLYEDGIVEPHVVTTVRHHAQFDGLRYPPSDRCGRAGVRSAQKVFFPVSARRPQRRPVEAGKPPPQPRNAAADPARRIPASPQRPLSMLVHGVRPGTPVQASRRPTAVGGVGCPPGTVRVSGQHEFCIWPTAFSTTAPRSTASSSGRRPVSQHLVRRGSAGGRLHRRRSIGCWTSGSMSGAPHAVMRPCGGRLHGGHGHVAQQMRCGERCSSAHRRCARPMTSSRSAGKSGRLRDGTERSS